MADQPSAALQSALEPFRRCPPGAGELIRKCVVAQRIEHDEKPRCPIRRPVVAQLPIPHGPAHVHEPLLRMRPVLVHDLARLLVGLDIVAPTLQPSECPKRRPRHVRTRRQELKRRDQRVAPEQRVEAARIVGIDGLRGRVGPALGREHSLQGYNRQPLTAPAVRPATIRFWKMITSTISGTVIVTVAAAIVPSGIWNCWLPVKNAIAADTGRRLAELVRVIESRNSFHAKMNASSPAVTSPGAASGITI